MRVAEKLKFIRKSHHMTQADFAAAIGISRGNLANIELGKVRPTEVFINCVCLTFEIDKSWLTDETNTDLAGAGAAACQTKKIVDNYSRLEPKYQEFVYQQIQQLLQLQD